MLVLAPAVVDGTIAGGPAWAAMPGGYEDDQVLVPALRAGDEAAFAWLLDRYDRPLRRFARTFVPSAAVADEVVQETWLGVIQGIDRFEGRSSVKTWLFRIMMNIARTRGVRERRSVPFSALGDDDGDAEPTFPPDRFRAPHPGPWALPPQPWDEAPHERLQAAETLAQVKAAIDELPPNQRLVISLRDIEGWSGDEVADLLEISPGNQRVLLHRARAKVRQRLDDYLFEEASA